MIIETCDQLLLSDFITCWCERTFSVLNKEHNTDPKEEVFYLSAWNKINKEYFELTQNLPTLKIIMLVEEIEYWKYQHMAVKAIVDHSRKWRDNELIEALKKRGYNYSFNHNGDLKQYHKDLDKVMSRAKTMLARIQECEDELKLLQKDNVGKEYTRADFDSDIMHLSKFMGYKIKKEETF